MRHARKLLLGTITVTVAAAPAALGSPPPSSAQFWKNQSGSAVCGKRIKQQGFELLCSAKGIPRPKSGHQGGDPFVVLPRTGKPQLVLLTQNEFPSGSPKTLPRGTHWERSGLTCTVGRKVTCKNIEGHGFTIGNGKYKSF
jgi:hypothetical protein